MLVSVDAVVLDAGLSKRIDMHHAGPQDRESMAEGVSDGHRRIVAPLRTRAIARRPGVADGGLIPQRAAHHGAANRVAGGRGRAGGIGRRDFRSQDVGRIAVFALRD